MSLRGVVDPDLCSGARECIERAPRSFQLNARFQSEAVAVPGDSDEDILEAAESCPYYAIRVLRDGEQVN